jgi:putative transcriptional regulator
MQLTTGRFRGMIKYKLVPPNAGRLLIAEPFMADGNFTRSVILLTAYEKEGVIGFVLNKPTDFSINDLMPDFGNEYGFDPKIYQGGPVQNDTLHFIHRLGNELDGSVKIGDNLWWGGDAAQLSQKIKLNTISEEQVRFFIGYSGWDIEQLENEIDMKSWIVADMTNDNVFDTDADNEFWMKIMQTLGDEYKEVANYPKDIHWN